jgi:hypothetical protein
MVSRSIFLNGENFQINVVERTKTYLTSHTHTHTHTHIYILNPAVYEIITKRKAEPEGS